METYCVGRVFKAFFGRMDEPAEQAERLHPDIPHVDIRDPATLRALAHPVRMQLLEQLLERSPATATELAERIGETQANCSWHLRQLHRYGLIEEVEGKGRQRPWRFVPQTVSLDLRDGDPAYELMWDVLMTRELQAIRTWRAAKAQDASEWRDAGTEWQTWSWLTAEELTTFSRELDELAKRHLVAHADRIDPERRPAGCRPIRFVAWTVPRSPETETPAAEPEITEPSTD